jgi:sensor histidine kinase YesM
LANYFFSDLRCDESLISSFQNRELEDLYINSKKYFNKLKNINSDFNNMHYYLPDNTSFLRMHKKDKYGDNLSTFRPIVSYVNKHKIESYGFELGYYGFYLRVVNPIYKDTEHIGSLGLGSNLSDLMNELYVLNNSIPLLLLNQKNILKKNINISQNIIEFENNIVFNPRNNDYINYIIQTTNLDILQGQEYKIVNYKNSKYLIHNAFPINNFNNITIGKIINVVDVTEDFYHLHHEMFISVTINSLLFIIILFLIYIILDNYIKEFKKIEQNYNQIAMKLKNISRNLNPHFLFNALSVLSELIYKDPKKADITIVKLSKFIRNSLGSDSLISLKQEFEFVSNYLDIQMIRFENKINYNLNIDNNMLDRMIPKFSIQLLIENIFKHAIIADKNIEINIEIKYNTVNGIEIIVSDNGKGFNEINKGFGLTSLEQVIKSYCHGELSYWREDNYTYFKINIKECHENLNS